MTTPDPRKVANRVRRINPAADNLPPTPAGIRARALRYALDTSKEDRVDLVGHCGDVLDLAETYAHWITTGTRPTKCEAEVRTAEQVAELIARSHGTGPEAAPGSPESAEPAPGVAGEASGPQRGSEALRLPTLAEWED